MFLGASFYKIDWANQQLLQSPKKIDGVFVTLPDGFSEFPINATLSYYLKQSKGTTGSGIATFINYDYLRNIC
jgi:hypothetical protein